jgi:hypothetical protein
MISVGRVVCGAAATALHAAQPFGVHLTIKNTHATDALILGDATVAAGTGFSLASGATERFEILAGDRLHGIRGAANDITAHVLVT